MGFDFIIKYKRGKENIVANTLSLREDMAANSGNLLAISRPIPNWVEAIKEEIQTNPTLKRLLQLVQEGEAMGPWKIKKWSFNI